MSYDNRIEKTFIGKDRWPLGSSSKLNENGSRSTGFVYRRIGNGFIYEKPGGKLAAYSNQRKHDYFDRHGKNDGITTGQTSGGNHDHKNTFSH